MKRSKFIFITGGVLSSLGKGLASASIGTLLEARGLTVTFQKLDPYINVDPGTMNPFQHGEVYVTEDGTETDLDLGHYERFTSVTLDKDSNFTSGKIYWSVINKERQGEYEGQTVQVVPHITDEIKAAVKKLDNRADVVLVEVGGTIGDIEGLPFIEALRQLRDELSEAKDCLFIHMTYAPYLKSSEELKTKPTQHSVRALLSLGIQPDMLIVRSEKELDFSLKKKIALFCNVESEAVISAPNVDDVYKVPVVFKDQKLDEQICKKLGIWARQPRMKPWIDRLERSKLCSKEVNIALVGKYVALKEAYKSLNEALYNAAIENNVKLNIAYIDSEKIDIEKDLKNVDGILVPGGFGSRGIPGKIEAIKYARENLIPYLGLCLGMQLMAVEFARNVCKLSLADSEEFNSNAEENIIYLMKEWIRPDGKKEIRDKDANLGGTLRLGAYPCVLEEKSLAYSIYKKKKIFERHRHRYEFNLKYKKIFEEKGMIFSGMSPDKKLTEIIEDSKHPFMIGVQFHPEFKNRYLKPHPLFVEFIKKCL